MRSEASAFRADFPKLGEGKDLIATGIRENVMGPCGEAMQSSCFFDDIRTGAQIEVVSVAKDKLYTHFVYVAVSYRFDGPICSYRHKSRGSNFTVREFEYPCPGGGTG